MVVQLVTVHTHQLRPQHKQVEVCMGPFNLSKLSSIYKDQEQWTIFLLFTEALTNSVIHKFLVYNVFLNSFEANEKSQALFLLDTLKLIDVREAIFCYLLLN